MRIENTLGTEPEFLRYVYVDKRRDGRRGRKDCERGDAGTSGCGWETVSNRIMTTIMDSDRSLFAQNTGQC